MKADQILVEAGTCLVQRGVDYDARGGERSMPHAVAIHNSITGHTMFEREGWLVMIAVKLARMKQSPQKLDTYIDLCAYIALLGETMTDGL